MRYVPRKLEKVVVEAAGSFASVVLTGPRRAGKTILWRGLSPRAGYILREARNIQAGGRSAPRIFRDKQKPPVIFDEIQNTPELLNYVRTLIDRKPSRK